MKIGSIIKKQRQARDLTQEQLRRVDFNQEIPEPAQMLLAF